MALPQESQSLFERHGVPVQFCGIGKVNATYWTTKLIHQGAQAILNLGTAGSHKFSTHTVVQCAEFVQRDMDLSPLGAPLGSTPLDTTPNRLAAQTIDLGYTWGLCGSGDRFENGAPRLPCDLVDMEGFAIAKVCHLERRPFYAYKYITDGSNSHSYNDWKFNLAKAAQALWSCYEKFVAHY